MVPVAQLQIQHGQSMKITCTTSKACLNIQRSYPCIVNGAASRAMPLKVLHNYAPEIPLVFRFLYPKLLLPSNPSAEQDARCRSPTAVAQPHRSLHRPNFASRRGGCQSASSKIYRAPMESELPSSLSASSGFRSDDAVALT